MLGNWGWIDNGVIGFIEYFGFMLEGCELILVFKVIFMVVKVDNGVYIVIMFVNFFGVCKDDLMV